MKTAQPQPQFETLAWAFLDPTSQQSPDENGSLTALVEELQRAKNAENIEKLWNLCLLHTFLRDLLQEEATRRPASGDKSERRSQRSKRVFVGPRDAELVEQAEQGIPGAFDILVERYMSVVIGAAYSLLSDAEAARDVAQDSFAEAAKNLALLRDREKFGNYVYGIARRKAIYVLRRRRMHQHAVSYKQEEERAKPAPDDPSSPLTRQERIGAIRKALAHLPEIYREVLVLKYIDNRSYQEISALLGLSLAAIDKRLMRGKEMLREALRKWGP